MLLASIIYLQTISVNLQHGVATGEMKLSVMGLICLFMALFYGTTQGLLDYSLEKYFFRKVSLGRIIVMKTVISLILLIMLFALVHYVLAATFIAPLFPRDYQSFTEENWSYLFYQFTIFYFFMTIVLSFILEVNKKFGPGVLLPILLGKYRSPRTEERIFLFMDLRSSTSIAEALGHLHYSGFIRDSFLDINQLLNNYSAEIYQYVGDEIVLSWQVGEGIKDLACVNFFFACEDRFREREDYYLSTYGQVPHFKAGLHIGPVTAVEIGKVKVDIAYHGDTINVASRIQSKCNEYQKKFLTSDHFLEQSGADRHFNTHSLGQIQLKGKADSIGISSIER